MTDKIIDGIDVSECDYVYTDRYNDLCCSCSISKDSPCKPSEMQCCFYVDHLKTELKEKEQECEHLRHDYLEQHEILQKQKKELSSLLAEKNAMEIGRDEYKQKCKMLETILNEIEKLTTIREVHGLTDVQYVENFRLHQERISNIINKAKEK